ncbi:protoporphyrinogen oxidase [Thiolapillus sp.]
METQVLIVGGGISGLSTAWWLAQQGVAVEIWEAAQRPGGKIRSRREAGYLTEDAAALLVNFRPQIDRLISSLGLEQDKQRRNDNLNRYIVHHNRLTRVPMLLPALLASPLWSLPAKLRLMAEPFIPKGSHRGETVSEFIRRRLGQEILDTAMDAFVSGTLASDPDLAEAQSVLPRLTALEQRYGSLTMGMFINKVIKRRRTNNAETFSFSGGMGQLVQALASSPGVTIRTGTRATAIQRQDNGWRVDGMTGNRAVYAQIPQLVLSTPADISSRLLRATDIALAELLAAIEYAPVGVLHLGMKSRNIQHKLDGTGFLVAKHNRLAINGNLWMSTLFPHRAPPGQALLSCYIGGVQRPGQLQHSDQELADMALRDLRPLMRIKGDADYVKVERHHQGLPLYHGQYRARLAQISSRLETMPGLRLNANYIDGISVRERIYQGQRTAQAVTASLHGSAYGGYPQQILTPSH